MSRVALIGENSKEYVDTLIDIWNNGDCAVLLDWRIPFSSLIAMMTEANVHQCFIEQSLFDKYQNINSKQIKFNTYQTLSNVAEKLPDYIYTKFHPSYCNDEAVIIYSSGTTGNAKGIILSHFAINTNADAIIDYMKPNKDECLYIVKPLSHSSSITGELLVALKTHMALVLSPTIVPPRYVFNAINKFGVSTICVNPTLLTMYSDAALMSNTQLSSLTKIYVSGSILKKQTLDKCRNTFKNIAIYNVYGLSEAGPRVAAQHANVQNENSVGSAISGVEIKIVDEDGQTVPIEEIGLIHIKTPSIFAGYVSGNKSLTSKLEGWHNTGDIGYFDNRNELHIVDRADDVIIIGAHKIYPTQIEQSIMEISDIQECTVVTANNATGKEILCCIYVSTNDVQTDIKNHLNKYFIKYEIPQLFIKVERIPKTSNGKTSRKQISAIITQILNDNTSNNYAYLFNLQTHK